MDNANSPQAEVLVLPRFSLTVSIATLKYKSLCRPTVLEARKRFHNEF